MLEGCSSLIECESVLAGQIRPNMLLSELPLTDVDVKKLSDLIREKISRGVPQGTRDLTRTTPACLAAFFVFCGIRGYEEGDYWSSVERAVGLVDLNWQQAWGRFYLGFLKSHDLPTLNIEGAHVYVAPILLHGGIPNSCLPEYFERVVLHFVDRELDDPTDRGELTQDLQLRREDELRRSQYESKLKQFSDEIASKRSLHRELDFVRRFWDEMHLSQQIERLTWQLKGLPADAEEVYNNLRRQLSEKQGEQEKLARQSERLQAVVDAFTTMDQALLDHEGEIAEWLREIEQAKARTAEVEALNQEAAALQENVAQAWAHISAEELSKEHIHLVSHLPFDDFREALQDELEPVLGPAAEVPPPIEPPEEGQKPAEEHAPTHRMEWVIILPLASILLWIIVPPQWTMAVFLVSLCSSAAIFYFWDKQETTRSQELAARPDEIPIEAEAPEPPTPSWLDTHLTGLPAHEHFHSLSPLEKIDLLESLAESIKNWNLKESDRIAAESALQEIFSALDTTRVQLEAAVRIALPDDLSSLQSIVKSTAANREKQVDAEMQLQERVSPQITDLDGEILQIESDITELERRIASLGDGDLGTGFDRLTEIHNADERVSALQRALASEGLSLDAIEDHFYQYRQSGKMDSLESDLAVLENEIYALVDKIENWKRQAQYYPPVFQGIDEPIRRFILYGGNQAEDTLFHSILMLHSTMQSGVVEAGPEIHLPQHIKTAFSAWWEGQEFGQGEDAEEVATRDAQKFRRPSIRLNPGTREVSIILPPQQIRLEDIDEGLDFTIKSASGKTLERDLRCYRIQVELVESQKAEIDLDFASSEYEFSLQSGARKLFSWNIPASRQDSPCFVFDGASGRLITHSDLPKSRVALLLGNQYEVQPASCVVSEGGKLPGGWSRYSLWQLQLVDVDHIRLVHSSGKTVDIPVSESSPQDIRLHGAAPTPGLSLQGGPVYTASLPKIALPNIDPGELGRWRLRIKRLAPETSEGLMLRLSDLDPEALFRQDNQTLVIDLGSSTLIRPDQHGFYRVRLRKPPYLDRAFTFGWMPGFKARFKKNIYPPTKPGEKQIITAIVSGLEQFPLKPLDHSMLEANHLIARDVDVITCLVEGWSTALSIEVPRLQWRLRGSGSTDFGEWQNEIIEELWYDDVKAPELFLDIKMPAWLTGKAVLAMKNGHTHEVGADLIEGRARFDFRALDDNISTGPAVREVELSLHSVEEKREAYPLFSLRTRWEAEDIKCIQSSTGNVIHLNISWLDKGRVGERKASVWKGLGTPMEPLKTVDVEAGKSTAEIHGTVQELPPGRYYIQIEPFAPWVSGASSRLDKNSSNVKLIHVVAPEDLRQGEVLEISHIVDSNQQVQPLNHLVHVRITGKIVDRKMRQDQTSQHIVITRNNEGWYLVDLIHPHDSTDQDEFAQANPIKVDYDLNQDRILAMEDRCGDGALYCRQCGRLFWSRELYELEKDRDHDIDGPIEDFIILRP